MLARNSMTGYAGCHDIAERCTLNRIRTTRTGNAKWPLLIAAAAVALVAIIIVTGIQEARRRSPAATTDAGPSTLSTGYTIRPFSARDLNGNTVDKTFFAEHRLTMVNVWGTFCGPCIREMPDLAQLPGTFPPADFAILGIVADTPDADNEKTARQLVATAGAGYVNLIPDTSIASNLLADISVVPTTFFVDRHGTVVHEILTGSRSKAEWQTIITGVLAGLPAGS
jgi:thiol-disulfide isomerase/thioredoxin